VQRDPVERSRGCGFRWRKRRHLGSAGFAAGRLFAELEELEGGLFDPSVLEVEFELLDSLLPFSLRDALTAVAASTKAGIGDRARLAGRRMLPAAGEQQTRPAELIAAGFADVLRSVERVCGATTVQGKDFLNRDGFPGTRLHNRPRMTTA
jgi:hypothetical protein